MMTAPHNLEGGELPSITKANGAARSAREILRRFETVKNRFADSALVVLLE
jgi:hypothetical protein